MARKIAIVNQKGGVGKTTSAVNLATGLTMLGNKVLLCDLDPQGNATTGMGLDKRSSSPNIYDVVLGDREAYEGIVRTAYGDVLPSNQMLAGANLEMYDIPQREFLLKTALKPEENNYDYILVDCPPSLDMLTINALVAAHSLMIPVQCEYFALEGLSDLIRTVKKVKGKLNPSLEIEGLLLTMYAGKKNLSNQVAAEVKRYFPGEVYSTAIPENVRLSEAPSHKKPIQFYDPSCKGAMAYGELAKEVMEMQRERMVSC